MKTTLKFGFAVAIIASTILSSCGKYEEGPKISLASKKGRLDNVWKFEKEIYDGQDITAQVASSYAGQTITFTKDGNITVAAGAFAFTGKWEFINKNEDVQITWTGSTTPDDTMHIIRLKSKELWTKDTQGGHTDEMHYVQN